MSREILFLASTETEAEAVLLRKLKLVILQEIYRSVRKSRNILGWDGVLQGLKLIREL